MLKTAAVMTNRFPWSDLVLDGATREKQGTQNIHHRGLVLLRTAKSRIDPLATDNYGLTPKALGCIVGAAELVKVEGLPGEYEYIFGRVGRFSRPIEFNPRGPVRWARILISPQIRRAVRRAGLGDLLG